jgi:hypothetical protein
VSRIGRLVTPLLLLSAVPAVAAAQANSVLMLLPTEGRELRAGEEFTGALSTSDFLSVEDMLLEAWEIEGRAGQTVTVDLQSDLFDPRLYATGPGFAETLFDDDSGGGCNARLAITFLENGSFRVVASSFGETGTYTIRVSEQPGPVPAYGCGEVNPAALAELPTAGRTLELGSVEAGVLASGARVVQDGRVGQAWQLVGNAGDRVAVVLESDDFDAYLYMTGPGLGEVLEDDDGAGDLNSRIEVTLPRDGAYTVVASALGAGSFGAYLLRVEEPMDPNALPIARLIGTGETATGDLLYADPPLVEGRRGQVWGFEAARGQRVLIDLESDDFDTYLYVVGPGIEGPLSDDDGGDGTDSQLSVTFPESGTYRIFTSAYASDGSGSYTLAIAAR